MKLRIFLATAGLAELFILSSTALGLWCLFAVYSKKRKRKPKTNFNLTEDEWIQGHRNWETRKSE